MTVDVVVPVHDGARTLERAIDSIRAQDADVVIRIVDDASSDGSAELAARLAESDPRIRLELLPVNVGVGAARNVAIRAGSAEHLAFLDQDDEWAPHALASQLAELAAHPSAGYVLGRQRFVSDEERPPSWARAEWFQSPQRGPLPGALVVRRDVFLRVGLFDERFRAGGDDSDWFARARRSRVPALETDRVVLIRHLHDRNQSADRRTDDDLLRVVRRHLRGNADGGAS